MKHLRLYLVPLLLLLLARRTSQAQSVGIGTATPDAAAALDIRASDKGLLIPRLTAGQRAGIATPPQGLLVYQTDGTPTGGPNTGFWYFGGSPAAWVFINPAGGGGDNLGNHTATTNLNLQANALTGTGASIGAAVGLGVRADGGLNLGQNTVGNNVFIGHRAGVANTTGSANQFIGYLSGRVNTTGNTNQFEGHLSGLANTTGSANKFSGAYSGISNTTGSNNHFDGHFSGNANTTGSTNQFEGYSSGLFNTTGSGNQFSGFLSGNGNTTGSSNQFTGSRSGYSNTTGSFNQFAGYESGDNNTTGSRNSFTGTFSGVNNTTGDDNTAVGDNAGPATGGLRNTSALGFAAKANASNKIRLGNAFVTVIEGQVGFSNPSDARFKHRVRADVPGLAFLTRLVPVTYRFDEAGLERFQRTGVLPAPPPADPAAPVRSGFLAQDVERAARAVGYAFDGLHAPANARDHYSLAYAQFVVPLVRAVQELHQQVQALQAQNAALQTTAAQATADHAALLGVQAQLARLLGEMPVARAARR